MFLTPIIIATKESFSIFDVNISVLGPQDLFDRTV